MLVGDRKVRPLGEQLGEMDENEGPEFFPSDSENISSCIKRGRYPRPKFRVAGKRLLVLQDEAEEKYGLLFIPENTADNRKPTVGTIVQIGSGYDPHEPVEAMQDWLERCPFKVGDRVLWGRWETKAIESKVHPDWWTDEEKAQAEKRGREGTVRFVVLEPTQVWGWVLDEPVPEYGPGQQHSEAGQGAGDQGSVAGESEA